MPFERALFVFLAVLGVLAFTGRLELPSAERRGGALALSRLEASPAAIELGGGAVVRAPVGARSPRPIVVVLGPGEPGCGEWHELAQGRAFTLCLRDDFASVSRTRGGLREALRRIKQRFGAYVAPGAVVLCGAEAGAEHAIALARQEPSFFARLALVDGGHELWSSSMAALFKNGGGQRVLFACRSRACVALAEREVAVSRTVGLEVELARASERTGEARAVAARFDWLVQGDPRFSPRGRR